jgi:ubiquitin carboxyl-terminal hydrolase 5/13
MADEGTLDVVRAAMKQAPIRTPQPHDRVYKEECMFSFDTALSPGGLYLNLNTWQSFGQKFVGLDRERTDNRLYLHEKAHKVGFLVSYTRCI